MTADGNYRVDIYDGGSLFTDTPKVAYDTAKALTAHGMNATAWEKDHSGWMNLFPGPKGQ